MSGAAQVETSALLTKLLMIIEKIDGKPLILVAGAGFEPNIYPVAPGKSYR